MFNFNIDEAFKKFHTSIDAMKDSIEEQKQLTQATNDKLDQIVGLLEDILEDI